MSDIKKTFSVKGMHCASCVLTIENSLKKLDGVSEATVNLATEKATVTYNPEKVTDERLSLAVASAGYQARIDQEMQSEDQERVEKQKELESLKIKVSVSLFLGG